MKFDIYDFSVLTKSIHESLNSMMGETAVMISEMVIVGIIFLTLFAVLGLILVYVERKICAFFQQRLGPMRVGFWGTAQTLADVIKLLFKEPLITKNADKFLFNLAPFIIIIASFMAIAAIPFANGLQAFDVDIGVFYITAISSIGVVGVLLAGWASNNKYSMIGGMRSAAQLMSYEIPLLLSMAGVFLLAGSFDPVTIVEQQRESTWLFGLPMWNIIPQFIGFVVFMVCILAEVERVPFDLPEAEAELVEGWTTEYSGIRFMFFLMAEYIRGFAGAAVATILFLGGWAGPWPVPPEIWFLIKVYLIIIFWVFIRWSVPRIRTDQILVLGWKKLLPLSLINILIVIFMVEIYPYFTEIVNLPEVF
jgi:NADH-quinone oxidoreductase subunit H